MNYDEAVRLMKTAKYPSNGKPLANNTRLHVNRDGTFEIRLHGNPIIIIHPTHLTLNSCGYLTVTTKNRMNTFTEDDIRIFQKNYQWYVEIDDERFPFFDGMMIPQWIIGGETIE